MTKLINTNRAYATEWVKETLCSNFKKYIGEPLSDDQIVDLNNTISAWMDGWKANLDKDFCLPMLFKIKILSDKESNE